MVKKGCVLGRYFKMFTLPPDMADDRTYFQKLIDSINMDVPAGYPCTVGDYIEKLQQQIDSIKEAVETNDNLSTRKEEIADVIEECVYQEEAKFPLMFQSIRSIIEYGTEGLSELEIETIKEKFDDYDMVMDKYAIPEAIVTPVAVPNGDINDLTELINVLEKIGRSVMVRSAEDLVEAVCSRSK